MGSTRKIRPPPITRSTTRRRVWRSRRTVAPSTTRCAPSSFGRRAFRPKLSASPCPQWAWGSNAARRSRQLEVETSLVVEPPRSKYSGEAVPVCRVLRSADMARPARRHGVQVPACRRQRPRRENLRPAARRRVSRLFAHLRVDHPQAALGILRGSHRDARRLPAVRHVSLRGWAARTGRMAELSARKVEEQRSPGLTPTPRACARPRNASGQLQSARRILAGT